MPLSSGKLLGRYQIVAPLGAGGMGEVYRAHDSRLGRDVAIKVLPQHLTSAPEMRSRFEREARTISQLSHPHICTLYDFAHEDGVAFLVMELVDGETLAHRLEKGPLALVEVLALGRQIAEALARAHRAGVVHRDLKPGNVMLTRIGAKLLDFGLARSTGLGATPGAMSHSPTMPAPLTAEGTIVGTFQYMAPEQLEGKEADARSDLWALGCVLYEMATGAQAFSGESQASLIAAIMTGEPRAMTELKPVTPPALERVVRHCLRKDPEDRFQSARDLAFALDLIASETLHVQPAGADVVEKQRPKNAIWVMAAIASLILAAGFLAGRMTSQAPSGKGIRVSTLSQGSRDTEPSVSSDGRLIAFNAVRQNGQGLWLMDMASRSEVKLTGENDHLPRFTPDGSNILFTRRGSGGQSLWRIPVLGGVARLVIQDAFDADPSPNGDRIAYISASTDSGVQVNLMLAKSDGTGLRKLWSRGTFNIGSPRWSPDGKRIAVILTGVQNTSSTLAIVDAAAGSARLYPSPNGAVLSNPVWDGSGGLVMAEGEGITAIARGASGRLLHLDARSGRYRELGWLENFPAQIDLLPDGRLVMSSLVVRQNLFEASLDSRDLTNGRRLTSGLTMDRQPVYSPDGKAVMFSSNRGGTLDLWEVSTETGEIHRVTDDPQDDWDPEYSQDGQTIVWCSNRSGAYEIWTARRDGNAPRQVSRDSVDAENPSITPDGRSVIYSSSHPTKLGVWRVPLAGGEGERLLRGATLIPDLSPDGRYLSVMNDVGTLLSKLEVLDLSTGKPLDYPVPLHSLFGTVQTGRSRVSADGLSVVYVFLRNDGQPVLLRRPLSAWRTGVGSVDTLFAGSTESIESFGLAPDGKRATVSLIDWLSGLTIAEGVNGIVPPKRSR